MKSIRFTNVDCDKVVNGNKKGNELNYHNKKTRKKERETKEKFER